MLGKIMLSYSLTMKDPKELGILGEDLATAYLTELCYEVLEKNWRSGNKEIDIIARKDKVLVIAEVKTRTGNYFGEPEEFIGSNKQEHLIHAANAYIEQVGHDGETRFDVIAITHKEDTWELNHIKDAFYPVL